MDDSAQVTTRVISADSTHVYCYSPPASLLSASLSGGGLAKFFISSNSIDCNPTYQTFTYLAEVSISTLSPTWVLYSSSTLVEITGSNFYSSASLQVRLTSSDGIR